MDAKFLKPLHVFKTLTDAGLEKKFATGLCVPSRTFHSAGEPPRLFLFSSSFSEINSSAKTRMALKRHTVLYRFKEKKSEDLSKKTPRKQEV